MAPPALPNQNHLYAFYLSRCGHFRVGKPNRHVLELLTEDEPSRLVRLAAESAARGVPASSLLDMEDGLAEVAVNADPLRVPVPLGQRSVFRLGEVKATSRPDGAAPPSAPCEASSGMVLVGARGMMPLLDLVACLPLLEELDLSNVASWFVGDAAAAIAGDEGISGNDVVARLCEVARSLPALRKIDIRSQPIGTLAAQRLVEAVQANPRLTEVRIADDHVEKSLCGKLRALLERNAAAAPALPPPALPERLPEYLLSLPVLDRKTLREQQLLRAQLAEDENFVGVLTAEQLSELVLHARVMSSQEVVSRCGGRGLRGDGFHLFIIKSGVLRAFTDLKGIRLLRGDYFGDTYAEALLPTCRLEPEERGAVYALPLERCGALLTAWGERVERLFAGLVNKAPLFQPLDMWTRVRLCTCCCETLSYRAGQVALTAGSASQRMWLVTGSGSFHALPGTEEDKIITGRYDAYTFERLDVFGVEALVARSKTNSVSVVAGKDPRLHYECAALCGTAVRLVQTALWAVLVAAVRPYSLHADCRQLARREPEWVYCI